MWQEAKIIILHKKGDRRDIKNYRPISLLPHTYKLFTRVLQNRMEKVLDENQPREQAGFRKGYSTTDHLQSLNQIIEKCHEYNLKLCVGFIDYEKAFDSIEHFAIFEALRKINISETYVQILMNIYKDASARIHLDNHVSEKFVIERGVRQGDPISPKLFTAAIEEIFKTASLSKGILIDGEHLKDLRFADDVALCTENEQQMEVNLNIINKESKKAGLRIHKDKTKYMTNYASNKTITVEEKNIEKVNEYKYLGQTIKMEERTKTEVNRRIQAAWSCFGRYREIFKDETLPISLKRQVFNQCIVPTISYGCQTWPITRHTLKRLRTAQRAMERKMMGIKIQDQIRHTEIRQKTKVIDIPKFILHQKWKWAGHVERREDARWTKICTEWRPRTGKRSRGRPERRWSDDIRERAGTTWTRRTVDRGEWRSLLEGYILQWMDNA